MKEIIEENYLLNIEKMETKENYVLIESNLNRYKLREVYDIKKIDLYIKYLDDNYLKIVLTKNNERYLELNQKKYVLLAIVYKEKNIPYFKPIIVPIIGEKRSDIWERKIDGYMKYLGMNAIQDEKIAVYLNYYIGLLENIICIYNKCYENFSIIRYTLSHNKISFPIIEEEYYDPYELLIDSIERDYAEIIKESNMTIEDKIKYSLKIIDKYSFNIFEINLFLIRIIYPKKFFDAVDDYLTSKYSFDLEEIIQIQKSNEKLYKDLITKIKPTNFIFKISWLL